MIVSAGFVINCFNGLLLAPLPLSISEALPSVKLAMRRWR